MTNKKWKKKADLCWEFGLENLPSKGSRETEPQLLVSLNRTNQQ